MVVIGGKGVGQALAAVAAALLIRLFSGPGPSMLLEDEDGEVDDPTKDENEDDDGGIEQGRVYPVTIRWRNITCSLSDKSSKTVSLNC